MFYKKGGAFYFCVKVNFSLCICYYFGNDLDVRKSSNKSFKNFKIIFLTS